MTCGCILDFLTWVSYNDGSVWNEGVLVVAVILVALQDTAKKHVKRKALEMREAVQACFISLEFTFLYLCMRFFTLILHWCLAPLQPSSAIPVDTVVKSYCFCTISSSWLCTSIAPLNPQQSRCLLGILTSSYASTLWKFTLWNMWRRWHPATFHPNPLVIHFQRKLAQCGFNLVWFFFICCVDTINMDWMQIQCTFNAYCGQGFFLTVSAWILLQACSCPALVQTTLPAMIEIHNIRHRWYILTYMEI